MPNLNEIKDQIAESNLNKIDKFLGKREIKELPEILWKDEKIESIVQGTYNRGEGILIATNKRLVFIDKGLLWGVTVEDFPYSNISSIQYNTGILQGKITIFASGNKSNITRVNKAKARDFSEYVRARITSEKKQAHKTNSKEENNPIEKLKKRFASGEIEKEEYQEKLKILQKNT